NEKKKVKEGEYVLKCFPLFSFSFNSTKQYVNMKPIEVKIEPASVSDTSTPIVTPALKRKQGSNVKCKKRKLSESKGSSNISNTSSSSNTESTGNSNSSSNSSHISNNNINSGKKNAFLETPTPKVTSKENENENEGVRHKVQRVQNFLINIPKLSPPHDNDDDEEEEEVVEDQAEEYSSTATYDNRPPVSSSFNEVIDNSPTPREKRNGSRRSPCKLTSPKSEPGLEFELEEEAKQYESITFNTNNLKATITDTNTANITGQNIATNLATADKEKEKEKENHDKFTTPPPIDIKNEPIYNPSPTESMNSNIHLLETKNEPFSKHDTFFLKTSILPINKYTSQSIILQNSYKNNFNKVLKIRLKFNTRFIKLIQCIEIFIDGLKNLDNELKMRLKKLIDYCMKIVNDMK
ncbi:hypothetical protein CANARDRAFT_192002, partial [[Candida] arabinofermentans NRRL YB-2248]